VPGLNMSAMSDHKRGVNWKIVIFAEVLHHNKMK